MTTDRDRRPAVTPGTEAGRRLNRWRVAIKADEDWRTMTDAILAIEAEAREAVLARLDRDALYRRIHALPGLVHHGKAEQCFPITDAVLALLSDGGPTDG